MNDFPKFMRNPLNAIDPKSQSPGNATAQGEAHAVLAAFMMGLTEARLLSGLQWKM